MEIGKSIQESLCNSGNGIWTFVHCSVDSGHFWDSVYDLIWDPVGKSMNSIKRIGSI